MSLADDSGVPLESVGDAAEPSVVSGESLIGESTQVMLRFVDIVMVLPSIHPVMVLEELEPPYRQLRIPIGSAEGNAIAYAFRKIPTPKPLTHELFTSALEAFGATLEVVRITEVRGAAFYAEMVFSGSFGFRTLSCRPSDAIALALNQALEVPLVTERSLVDQVGVDRTATG